MKFGVVGAGIIGLTTATELLSAYPSAEVTLIGDKFGQDTTSDGAAGIFRPGGGFRISGDKDGTLPKEWLKNSWEHYYALQCSAEDPALHGVKPVSGYMFSSGRDTTKNSLMEDIVPIYRNATPEELKICPGEWEYGSYYTTMVIDSSLHLKWLGSRLQGKLNVRKARVENWSELSDYDYVFNCTGLGAKWLCHDDNVVPIRGQVFKVKAPWIKMFYYSNTDTYIIPGMDTVTLGGTRQFDNYNTTPDPHDSAGIWERCTQLLPNLQAAQVVREWAGLRPYRDGGVRAELEVIKIAGGGQVRVIHNYGHGGYGVTFAPGSAKHAVKIFTDSHRSSGFWRLWKSKI